MLQLLYCSFDLGFADLGVGDLDLGSKWIDGIELELFRVVVARANIILVCLSRAGFKQSPLKRAEAGQTKTLVGEKPCSSCYSTPTISYHCYY